MNCLLDTNVFIEAFKQEKEAQNILELLIENSDWIDIYIPYNVVEETIFLLLKKTSNTNYWQLKKNKSYVVESFKKIKLHLQFIFNLCEVLYPNEKVLYKALKYIENYGLLPNDAFVLAFCKVFKINTLISFDSDFSEVAEKEGIALIKSVKELKDRIG